MPWWQIVRPASWLSGPRAVHWTGSWRCLRLVGADGRPHKRGDAPKRLWSPAVSPWNTRAAEVLIIWSKINFLHVLMKLFKNELTHFYLLIPYHLTHLQMVYIMEHASIKQCDTVSDTVCWETVLFSSGNKLIKYFTCRNRRSLEEWWYQTLLCGGHTPLWDPKSAIESSEAKKNVILCCCGLTGRVLWFSNGNV